MSIFVNMTMKKPSFFQKLFGLPLKENFVVELNNLLKNNERNYTNISETDISELMLKYKVKNLKTKIEVINSYFAKILKDFLSDDKLTEDELNQINHIRRLFGMSEQYVVDAIEKATEEIFTSKVNQTIANGIIGEDDEKFLEETRKNLNISKEKADSIMDNEIKNKGESIYRDNVRWALSDGELTEKEKENLDKIQKYMKLSETTAFGIYGEEAKEVYNRYLTNMIADERLSPEEERQLEELGKKLGGIHFDLDYATKNLLEKYKLFWTIENGDVPEIASDISLQRGEKLYSKISINWYELRTVTQRVNYSGMSYRIKICKGLYYRIGSATPQRITQDVYKLIDSGDVYLTNKRILFVGSKANKTIRLNKIISFSPYSNGVEIGKDTGKSPFFKFSGDVDLFCMFLSRAINDC